MGSMEGRGSHRTLAIHMCLTLAGKGGRSRDTGPGSFLPHGLCPGAGPLAPQGAFAEASPGWPVRLRMGFHFQRLWVTSAYITK